MNAHRPRFLTGLAILLLLQGPGLLAEAPVQAEESKSRKETEKEVREFLDAWAARMENLRTLRVRFVQTKKLQILRRPRVSQGLALLKEKRFVLRMVDAAGEREMEIAVEGGEAKIYYPRLKRLEIYDDTGGERPASPFIFFGEDIESLPETHALELLREGGDRILVMRPSARTSDIVEARLRFPNDQIIEVWQKNHRGDTIRLEITEFTVNPEIPDSKLRLDLPPDTKIVRPFGGDSGRERR